MKFSQLIVVLLLLISISTIGYSQKNSRFKKTHAIGIHIMQGISTYGLRGSAKGESYRRSSVSSYNVQFGAFWQRHVKKAVKIEMGADYNRIQYKHKYQPYRPFSPFTNGQVDTFYIRVTSAFNYINFPINFKFIVNPKNKVQAYFLTGFHFNFLLSYNIVNVDPVEVTPSEVTSAIYDLSHRDYRPFIGSIVFGFGTYVKLSNTWRMYVNVFDNWQYLSHNKRKNYESFNTLNRIGIDIGLLYNFKN